jgi:branched-chain amino acid aminotransferase
MSNKAALKPYPFAYFEDKTIPLADARLSIMTNALHYGIGIFGGIKSFETAQGPAIFRLDDHVRRLQQSVETLGFDFAFDRQETKEIILSLARKNKIHDTTYIRPIIYRSDTDLSPHIAGEYSLAVYMLNMPHYFDPSEGLRVTVSSWQRNAGNAIPPRTKATGGYINSALAIHEANQHGFDSAIMLDKNGDVGEGAVMNLFIVKNNQLITPSLDSDILEGITRRTVIELAEVLSIPITERKVKQQELHNADEIFFTGTAADITWCSVVDEVEISRQPGPLTGRLRHHFQALPEIQPELFTPINL